MLSSTGCCGGRFLVWHFWRNRSATASTDSPLIGFAFMVILAPSLDRHRIEIDWIWLVRRSLSYMVVDSWGSPNAVVTLRRLPLTVKAVRLTLLSGWVTSV